MRVAWPCAIVLGALVVMSGAACQSTFNSGSEYLPTLAVENHRYDVQRYRGQTVRACGRLVRRDSDWAVEHVAPPSEIYFHGAPAVLVIPCGARPPRHDGDSCITGRIAARDGRLTLPLPRRVVEDDSPVDREWFLHPQCRSR